MKFSSVLLSKIEIAFGFCLIVFACLSVFRIQEDPHGIIFVSLVELGIYGIATLICGFALLKIERFWLLSQCVFIAASIFIFIEFFTSYSGWWL